MSNFWQTTSAQLEQELTSQQYRTWIKPLSLVSYDKNLNIVKISAPNRFKLDWVKSQFSNRIIELTRQNLEQEVKVLFILSQQTVQNNIERQTNQADENNKFNEFNKIDENHDNESVADKNQLGLFDSKDNEIYKKNNLDLFVENTNTDDIYEKNNLSKISTFKITNVHSSITNSKLNSNLTFETLVTGKANQLARAAATQVADSPGNSYNPLFLYGGVGLGKTHIMHAIGNTLLHANKNAKIRYIHAEQYVSDVVKAYQRKNFEEFKYYYHSLNLLLIDDVQFFSGKSRTQEEFFYVFEALASHKAQLVITSDTYPKEINGIDERLISRFDSGLTVAIEPPELEMRVAILLKKAEIEAVHFPEDVAFFVAKHLRSNVRELEGALRKIVAFSRFHGREITIDSTRDALKDLLTLQNRQISVESIQKTVADFYNIKVAEMYSKNRPANIAKPRQIAMYLAKELTQKSFPEIGELFGGRDHTTVLHAVRKISEERSKNTQLNRELHVLDQTIKG